MSWIPIYEKQPEEKSWVKVKKFDNSIENLFFVEYHDGVPKFSEDEKMEFVFVCELERITHWFNSTSIT